MAVQIRVVCLSILMTATLGLLAGCGPADDGKPRTSQGKGTETSTGSPEVASATPTSTKHPAHGEDDKKAHAEPEASHAESGAAVLPSKATIENGTYKPLSRPLFIHVNKKSLQRPEVAAFVRFYVGEGQPAVARARYIPLHAAELKESQAALEKDAPKASEEKLSGKIVIDGSSTVYLITVAMVKDFKKKHPDVDIQIGRSGTGGGFKKFTLGDTDINDSSRPITASEIAKCKEKGIEYLELKVGLDGITLVVNSANDFCKSLSAEQLKELWKPGSKINKWSDIDSSWPSEEIKLYGPDADSGTFEFFTEAIVGKAKSVRDGVSVSADDSQLVQGVKGDKYALGYFGYAYYVENKQDLKAVGVIPSAKSEKKKE